MGNLASLRKNRKGEKDKEESGDFISVCSWYQGVDFDGCDQFWSSSPRVQKGQNQVFHSDH